MRAPIALGQWHQEKRNASAMPDHQGGNPQHARAGEAQPLRAGQRPQRVAQHAAGMARASMRLEAVQARPFQRRSWRPAAAPGRARTQPRGKLPAAVPQQRWPPRTAASQPQGPQRPRGTSHQTEKPNRKIAGVGQPGAEQARPVAQRRRQSPEVDQAGSPSAWVIRASSSSSHSTAPTNISACRRQRGASTVDWRRIGLALTCVCRCCPRPRLRHAGTRAEMSWPRLCRSAMPTAASGQRLPAQRQVSRSAAGP